MSNLTINQLFVTPELRNKRVYQGGGASSVSGSNSSSTGGSAKQTLQDVLNVGNETTQSIVLQTADKSKSYTIAIDTNGNLVLTGSTANTAVISNGDIQAYAGSNPAINWWDGLTAIVDGSTVTYSGGQLHAAGGSTYSLPIASSSVLGGVKQGTNITIDANGVISASAAAQVQSDWNVTTGLGKILNKPTTLSGYGITDAQPFSTAWNTGNFTPSNYVLQTALTSYQLLATSWNTGNANLSTVNWNALNVVAAGTITAGGTITANGGNFNAIMGAKTTWGGTSYPTVYGTSSESWVMIHMPHIPYLQTGSNGYSGIGYGSSITFATDAATTHHYRVGSFTNESETSVDAFRIVRDSTSKLLEINNIGDLRMYGTSAGLTVTDRTYTTQTWTAYSTSGIYRIYSGGDKLTLDTAGNQSITGIYNSNNATTAINLRIGSQNDASTAPTNTAQVIATNGNLHIDAASTHNIYLGYYNNLVTYVGTGGLSVSGTITATGDVTAYSDRRLKTNLHPIKSVLTSLYDMSGYRFNRIDTEDKKRVHIGLIAQEIEKHYPELVHDDGVTKSVNYMGFTAVLLQAIKELKTKVSELERRVN